MHLEVTFKNLRPREEIRRRAQALFGKLERFLDSASDATLIVATEHGVTRTELTVTAHGHVHQASEEDQELRSCLDKTFHRVEMSLRRTKERRVDRFQKGAGERPDGFVVEEGDDEEEAAI